MTLNNLIRLFPKWVDWESNPGILFFEIFNQNISFLKSEVVIESFIKVTVDHVVFSIWKFFMVHFKIPAEIQGEGNTE